MTTTANTRFFEVFINSNFFNPSTTLVCKTEKEAIKLAKKEAKFNKVDTIDIVEVDENGDDIDGFVSGSINTK